MESEVLNELFDSLEVISDGNEEQNRVKELINYIKSHEHYDVFLEAMFEVRRDLFVDDDIHGIAHNERVALLACAIGMKEGLNKQDLRLLLEAAKYHDIGRRDKEKNHAKISADKIGELRYELFYGFTDEEVKIIQALSEAHGVQDELNESVISTYGVPNVENCMKILNILKDADALDRVRLRFGQLDESRIRLEESKTLIETAKDLLQQYDIAKTISKYDRGAVEFEFDSSIFNMDSYNVIEDDENYYIFRTLNEDNERELDDDYEKYLRTSRERAERKEETVKYTEDSIISLAEVYDNIKFTHGDKNTNCISFSTNTNVSLDYRNDRYVMLRVPKEDLGQLVVSGKYMLEEINDIIESKIRELLEDEKSNKEILSLISQINNSVTPNEVADIVVKSYKGVKKTEEKYTGSKNSILTSTAIRRRFSNKQYLTEEQQFEYNRLIAKLTVLETRGKLGSLLPTQLTNTALISSIGTAFSSSEMIHYREVDKENLIEVSKENMEMFALLQQAEALSGVNKDEIDEIKRDFLYAVQSGYELRMHEGRIVYSNRSHRVDLGTAEEFDGIFDMIELPENTPIENAYNVFRKKNEDEVVIPYIKGKAAIEFTRKLALSKLKNEEYWRILAKISPIDEYTLDRLSRNTLVINSDIISRINDSGVKLIESVNIDIADDNSRRLFTNEEIAALWNRVKNLSKEELEKVVSEDFDFFKDGYFDSLIDGKVYPQGENEYYADTIVDGLDLTKVFNLLKPGSEKIKTVKERIREKLNKVDSKKLYMALYNNGISENEIPNYIVNMILDDGIGKDINSFEKLVSRPDLDNIISEYKENLKVKVSAIRVNMFLGIKDNDYIVKGTKIKLRDYQKEALDNVGRIYGNGKRFVGVKLPTGAGKSFVAMSEMMNRAKENMVYFAPQEEILLQVQRHIVKYILDKDILNENHIDQLISMSKHERRKFLENKIYNPTVDINQLLNKLNDESLSENEKNTIKSKILPRRTQSVDDVMDAIHTVFPHLEMCCYQSLTASKYEELTKKKIDFFVFDELHRSGATTWKERIDKLLEIQKDSQLLGITATPIRDVDGIDTMEEMAKSYGGYTREELISKEYYAAEMTLIDAMQRKIVVEPIIVPFNANLKELPEYQDLSSTVEELERTGSNPQLLQRLRINLSEMNEIAELGFSANKNDKLVGIEKVLANNITGKKKNGRFIVFIPQTPSDFKGEREKYVKQKIEETSKYFEGVNKDMMIEYLLSNREGGDKANARAISEFENMDDDRLKLLYAINKLNEGVHVENISGEVMLRPIGAGSNILYFQQIGRVIYAIDPENPPEEDDIPIIFDVYNNYIARDLDKEANYSTTISDLSRLQEIVNWINRHEALPDIDSSDKNEVNKAMFLKKVQNKYSKYLDGINNPNLTETEIYEIQKILELGKSFNLFELDIPDRTAEDTFDFRVRTFEVVGEQKRFLDIYNESKKEISKVEMRNKVTDAIKIREGVGILKVLSSYGVTITDEAFEAIKKDKKSITLAEFITSNFDVPIAKEVFNDLKMTHTDAEDVPIYQVFDYLRQSFMNPKTKIRNHFNYYEITDLRRCGILKENGKYIPIIDEYGFVHERDFPYGEKRAPSSFVNLNVITGTIYDEQGYDISGFDIDGYNREGYNKNGIDRLGFKRGEDKNKYGFNRSGINEDTNSHLDINGFDINGYFWKVNPLAPNDIHQRIKTDLKLNEYNFDRDGNYYEYDENGELVYKGRIDKYGFVLGQQENEDGFRRDGISSKTGQLWDEYGFDIDKIYWKKDPKNPEIRIKTKSKFNEYGFARDGFYYEKDEAGNWKKVGAKDPLNFKFAEEYNTYGFDRTHIHKETGELWNPKGFDIYGFYWEIDYKTGSRIKTDRKLDPGNFDINGYFWKEDEDGEWIRKGKYNDNGKKQGEGVNEYGFRADGTHKVTNKLWDEYGFDINQKYWAEVNGSDERVPTGEVVNEYGFKRNKQYCEKDENGNWVELGLEDRLGFKFGRPHNERGFDRSSLHGITNQLWDKNGFDINGIYWEKDPENPGNRINTGNKLDKYGFNYNLKYCTIGTDGTINEIGDYDPRGFRFGDTGTNKYGFYRNGIHSKTEKHYNEYYFDVDGNFWEQDPRFPLNPEKRRKTKRKYDEYGKDISGRAAEGVPQKDEDKFGFKRGEDKNSGGFYRNGIHSITGKPWNPKGFGIDGYYWALKEGSYFERERTDKKYNEEHIDTAGFYCIEYEGRFIRLHRFRNKFWECVKKQEATERKGTCLFEDGAYDSKGFWWHLDEETKQYIPTGSKYHPKKGWDQSGYNKNRKYVAHDEYGFQSSGNHMNGKNVNDRGFNSSYIHSITGKEYDENFFDIDGFYWEYDSYNNKRVKSTSKYNELGITCDGDCLEDNNGYDDIGMKNETLSVNEKYKSTMERERFIAREGEEEELFRKTQLGYYYMDSNSKYNPNDGLDFFKCAPNGYDINGVKKGPEYKRYKVIGPEDDSYFETYDDLDELEEYEYEYNPNSPRRIRERMIEERREMLYGLSDENIDNIRSNQLRYRKKEAPARLEAAQLIRDTWMTRDKDIYDDDGELLVDPWEIDTIGWRNDKKWNDYVQREELLKRKIKKSVELDGHGFDSEGIFYNIYTLAGQEIAEPTLFEYDKHHFDKDGFYWIVDDETGMAFPTDRKYDDNGFDQNGFYCDPEKGPQYTLYNPEGYDRDGYDKYGFNKRGVYRTGGPVNSYGFTADGRCLKNNGLRYDKNGFTLDGKNFYTGTYRDILGLRQRAWVDPTELTAKPNDITHLNDFGINPNTGKNSEGFIDPTIRFARYYYSEILEEGRDPDELIKCIASAYKIDLEKMEMLAEQKLFVAKRGYPKLTEEIQEYYEKGKARIGKNYDMHKKLQEAEERRKQKLLDKLETSNVPITPDTEGGTDKDDDL